MKNKLHFNTKVNRIQVSTLLVSLAMLFPVFSVIHAENIISSGTTLKVMPGTSLVSSEALTIKNGATLDNAGTLILKKNLTNENPSPNTIGSGVAEFSGISNQTVTGQNVIQALTVNNAAGVTIGGSTRVNGTLTLTNGRVTLGSNNLVLGSSAVIVGTPSASVMIVVTGSGELRKEFPAGFTGTFTYPVGDDSGTPEYAPVILVFTGGTFASDNYVGVSLANTKYPDPNITGNYLNRYWNITQSGITGFTCNASFQYLPADVTGTENKLSCTMVNPLPWITYALTNSGTHVLSANGIGTFGTYTGVKSTTPPENQLLANNTIPGGTITCYDATQVLTVAGNGTTFLVESGGNVTLVAGAKILLLDGAKVNSGGMLHGYITSNGIYCGASVNPLVANNQNGETVGVEATSANRFIRIYPNPTTDLVVVELIDAGGDATAHVTVYSMVGGKLLQKSLNGESRFQFSLEGRPVGIYMVHVQSGERSEVAKVVKN